MFCTSCGAANPETGHFCITCGKALPSPSAPGATPTPAPGVTPVPAPAVPPSAYSSAPMPTFAGAPETSGKAIASFICGLCFWAFPAAVAAIILGHLSLSDMKKSAGRVKGRGLAIGGLVLGYGGVLIIPFILIVAAIAIPNLLRSRMAANEASAVGSIRVMEVAAVSYAATYGNGFPPNLDVLGLGDSGTASCDHAQLLTESLAIGEKNGYRFVYFLEPSANGSPTLSPAATANGCTLPGGSMYEIHADPMTRGTTGQRSFYTDQTGIIRFDAEKPATADSEILGQ